MPRGNKRKRTPTCSSCRNHGETSDLRNHKRYCKYAQCNCIGCTQIRQRKELNAKRQKARRDQKQDDILGITWEGTEQILLDQSESSSSSQKQKVRREPKQDGVLGITWEGTEQILLDESESSSSSQYLPPAQVMPPPCAQQYPPPDYPYAPVSEYITLQPPASKFPPHQFAAVASPSRQGNPNPTFASPPFSHQQPNEKFPPSQSNAISFHPRSFPSQNVPRKPRLKHPQSQPTFGFQQRPFLSPNASQKPKAKFSPSQPSFASISFQPRPPFPSPQGGNYGSAGYAGGSYSSNGGYSVDGWAPGQPYKQALASTYSSSGACSPLSFPYSDQYPSSPPMAHSPPYTWSILPGVETFYPNEFRTYQPRGPCGSTRLTATIHHFPPPSKVSSQGFPPQPTYNGPLNVPSHPQPAQPDKEVQIMQTVDIAPLNMMVPTKGTQVVEVDDPEVSERNLVIEACLADKPLIIDEQREIEDSPDSKASEQSESSTILLLHSASSVISGCSEALSDCDI